MAPNQTIQGLAGLGRNGDSTLVHMQPQEVAGLQALAQSQGTSLTINPNTGLPEAFNLGGFFRALAPTLAGLGVGMIPGMQGLGYGIAAGALTGAALNKDDPLMGAVMGGMGGYGGANLAAKAGSFGAEAAKAGMEPSIAALDPNVPANIAQGAGAPNAFANQGAMVTNPAGFGGLGVSPQTTDMTSLITPPETFGGNLSQAYSNVAAKPMDFIGQNKMAIGMPLAGAALGGLEPSDLYGEQLQPGDNPDERYDPYASLNLNTDTGLRLYASGGPVSFADGGDTGKDPVGLPGGGLGSLRGGGAGAMEGANMLPIDVSDINARYRYDPTSRTHAIGTGAMYGNGYNPPLVEVPKLGLFADNEAIDAARTAYETQLKNAMTGRFGMGNMGIIGAMGGPRGMTSQPAIVQGLGGLQNPNRGMTQIHRGISGMGATAPTAETALSRLNLNTNYAKGGELKEGGFIVPADVVSHLGNGSTDAGLKLLAETLNATPIKGDGDGMSDSIPTTIEGRQPALVADGEAYIPPEVVARYGGPAKFEEMMEDIRKERTGKASQGTQINPEEFIPS